jgi:hypothetical protein
MKNLSETLGGLSNLLDTVRAAGSRGSRDPRRIMQALLVAIIEVDTEWREVTKDDRVTVQEMMLLSKMTLQTVYAWMTRSSLHTLVPGPNGKLLSEAATRRTRVLMLGTFDHWLAIFVTARRESGIIGDDEEMIELNIYRLFCNAHVSIIETGDISLPGGRSGREMLAADARRLLRRLERLASRGSPADSWSYAALSQLFVLCDETDAVGLAERALAENRGEQEDLLNVALVAWASSIGSPPSAEVLDILDRAFKDTGSAFAPERTSLLSRVQPLAEEGLLQLIRTNRLDGVSVLLDRIDLWSLGPTVPADKACVYLIADTGKVWALLRIPDHALKIFSFEVPETVMVAFRDASITSDDDALVRARRSLLKWMRGLMRISDLSRFENLLLAPIGKVSWWPWMSVSSAGRSLAQSMSGIAIRQLCSGETLEPARSTGKAVALTSDQPSGPDLLVVDTLFPEAQQVIASWKKEGFSNTDIVSYDSSRASAESLAVVRSRLGSARFPWVFAHAISHAMEAGQTGLLLGADSTLTLEELRADRRVPIIGAVIIACESGRQNYFVSGRSVSQAVSLDSAGPTVSTLWAIHSKLGRRFFETALASTARGSSLRDAWLEGVGKNVVEFSAFVYSSP